MKKSQFLARTMVDVRRPQNPLLGRIMKVFLSPRSAGRRKRASRRTTLNLGVRKVLTVRTKVIWALIAALSATVSAAADAPPSRYTFSVPGTVFDTRTNLTWQRELDHKRYDQPAAITYCRNLATAKGGWRLPTRTELLTITDLTRVSPAIDTAAFPGTEADYFWSSSESFSSSGFRDGWWTVYFDYGSTGSNDTPFEFFVRCVR